MVKSIACVPLKYKYDDINHQGKTTSCKIVDYSILCCIIYNSGSLPYVHCWEQYWEVNCRSYSFFFGLSLCMITFRCYFNCAIKIYICPFFLVRHKFRRTNSCSYWSLQMFFVSMCHLWLEPSRFTQTASLDQIHTSSPILHIMVIACWPVLLIAELRNWMAEGKYLYFHESDEINSSPTGR